MFDLLTFFIYISLLVSLVGLAFLGAKVKGVPPIEEGLLVNGSINLFHWIIFIIIFFIVGFRNNVGTDWNAYNNSYNYLKLTGFSDQNYELGFLFINKFFANLNMPVTFMFGTIALIGWIFIIKSQSLKILPFLIFLIFVDEYFFWSMNVIRQFVSMAIFLYAIKFIEKKDVYKYFTLITIACLFHYSALILFPLYFVPWGLIYNKRILFIIFLVSLFLSNLSSFVGFVYLVFFYIVDFIPFLSKYSWYFQSTKLEATEVNVGLGYLFRVIIVFIIIYFSNALIEKYPTAKIYITMFLIGSIIFNLFFMFTLLLRINQYFLFMRCSVLAILLYYLIIEKKNQWIGFGLIFLYFLLFLVTIYNSSNLSNPFRFYV